MLCLNEAATRSYNLRQLALYGQSQQVKVGLVRWVTSDPGGSEVLISSWSSGSCWGDPGGPEPARARLHISPKLMSSDPKYALKRRIVERCPPFPPPRGPLTSPPTSQNLQC